MAQEQQGQLNTALPTTDAEGLKNQYEALNNFTDNNSPLKADSKTMPSLKAMLYTDEELRRFQIRGAISMVGGMLLHIVLGTFYLWGNISAYVAAYFKQYDVSVTNDLMGLTFPILGLIMFSCLSFGIKIAERIGFNVTIGCGVILIALAFLICSYVTTIGGFIAVYCIFIGISSGLLYSLPILCGWRYFPLNRGLISGLIIGGYGFGSFIFGFVCKAIVNPHGLATTLPYIEDGKTVKYFGPEVYDKVPEMLRVLAGCYLGLGVIASLMIRFPHEIDPVIMLATLEHNRKKNVSAEQLVLEVQAKPECHSIKQGIMSKPFVILVPLVLCSTIYGMMISNSYKIYGQHLGINDSMLTTTGSVAGAVNGCSRFFWAQIMDKTSFKFTFMIISVISLATSASMPYIGDNGLGYLFVVAFSYLAEGGLFAIFPPVSAKCFGKTLGGVMYGFFFFTVGIANMIGYLLYRYARLNIGYEGVYWICFMFVVVSMIAGFFLTENDYHWSQPTKVEQKPLDIVPEQEPIAQRNEQQQ